MACREPDGDRQPIGAARRLDDLVEAVAAGESTRTVLPVLRRAVEDEVRATRLGGRATGRVRLRDHDGPDACQARQREQHQPRGSAADDEQRQARQRLQPVDAVDGAADRLGHAGDHRIDAIWHLVGQSCRDHHGRGHAAVEMDPEGPLVGTQVLPAQPAVAARTAVEMRFHRYQVPFTDGGHAGTQRRHATRDLMAQDRAQPGEVGTLEDARVRAADAHRERCDAHLTDARFGDRPLAEPQLTDAFEADAGLRRGGVHGHGESPVQMSIVPYIIYR